MISLMVFIKKHWLVISLLLIILFAAVLRFYNFDNRWGLAYDQARDAIVVREALQSHRIPLIGPFSASGPFVFGPHWYWIFMGVTVLYPGSVLTPWIFQGILYIGMVFFMYIIGKELYNKKFGLLLSLFTAVSTAQIAQSTNLAYSSFVGFLSMTAFYLLARYIKDSKTIVIFLLAFTVGVSINVHFQAIGLLTLLPAAVIFGKVKLRHIFISGVGFVIPFIPWMIFDLQSNNFQSTHLMEYFFSGGNEASMPKRWLTYAGVFWPEIWARIIGGQRVIAYLIIVLLSIVTFYVIIKKKISRLFLAVVFVFLLNFVTLRYVKGGLFDAFFVYLHPAVLILTGWVNLRIYKISRIAGVIIVLTIITGSMIETYFEIKNASNITAGHVTQWKNALMNEFPGKKFAIHDYQLKTTSRSFPLVLFLQTENLIDDNGVKIGMRVATIAAEMQYPRVYGNPGGGLILFDLRSSSSAQLSESEWAFVNPSIIYHSIVEWYKDEEYK